MNINILAYILVVIGYLAAVLGIFKDFIPQSNQKSFCITLFFVLTIIAMGQLATEWLKVKKEWAAITSGRLVSKVSTGATNPVIKLGGAGIDWSGGPEKPAVLMGKTGDAIFLRLANGEAKITLSIRDSKGAVLATVRDNEWFVGSSSGVSDRNFNQDTLEVLGEDGEPVLQLRINGEKAELAFKTYGLQSGPPPSGMGPWLSEINGSGSKLFKYPSVKHQGELAPPRVIN